MVTIGGWTGSSYFSTAVANDQNRTIFINNLQALVKQYDLDGLDFEYVFT